MFLRLVIAETWVVVEFPPVIPGALEASGFSGGVCPAGKRLWHARRVQPSGER